VTSVKLGPTVHGTGGTAGEMSLDTNSATSTASIAVGSPSDASAEIVLSSNDGELSGCPILPSIMKGADSFSTKGMQAKIKIIAKCRQKLTSHGGKRHPAHA
jgi:hypothetical protein